MSIPSRPTNVLPFRPNFSPLVPQVDEPRLFEQRSRFELKNLLESLWHNSAEAMRITDSKGVIVEANEAFCRLMGMRREEFIGKSLWGTSKEGNDSSRSSLQDSGPTGETTFEQSTSRQTMMVNGKEACFEVSDSYVAGGGGELFLVSMFRNVSDRWQAEEALRASELRFRSVAQSAVDAIVSADSRSTIISWNDAACRMFGFEAQEILGQSALHLIPERFREAHQRGFERLRLTGEPRVIGKTVELVGLRKDGTEFPIEMSLSAWASAEGPCFSAIIRDITERRQMRHALERERSLLRTVIDNLPDRIFAKDADCRFIINNKTHVRALGAESPAAVVGKTDFDFRPRELAERMFQDDQAVIRSGAPIVEKEEWRVDPLGESVCVLVTKVPMRDDQGNVIGLVGISRNITDQKRSEEALRESERKYHALFDNAVQGIFRSSVDGKLLSANPALLTMLGYDSFEELACKNLVSVYANPEERNALTKMLAEKGARANIELTLRRKDGSIIVVLEHSHIVKDDDGNVIAYEGIIEDITEQRALETRVQEHLAALKQSQESLAELNAQKDRLFSILSHDLRSPFTSILGFCDILLNDNEVLSVAEREEFLGHIQNSAEKQMALLNRLLDWSRLETGRMKFDAKDLDLSKIVASTLSAHLGTAMKKEITLQSSLSFPVRIRGDEVMITQVFSNLISNALKFTPSHGVISVELVDSTEDHWTVSVKDTGAGIPKDDFKKLFKIEEKYTRKGLEGEEGTGLGLSLVDEIVRKHSGSITIESDVGRGTTVFLHFPRLVEDGDQCVLIVDDDEGVRVLHSRYLKRMFPASRILQASDGKEGFELARRCRPRLIVSDYSMPEMNGFGFLNLLRGEPATKEIPVFVVTGKDSTASKEALRLGGAVAVLTKPVSSAQLQEVIEKAMADRV